MDFDSESGTHPQCVSVRQVTGYGIRWQADQVLAFVTHRHLFRQRRSGRSSWRSRGRRGRRGRRPARTREGDGNPGASCRAGIAVGTAIAAAHRKHSVSSADFRPLLAYTGLSTCTRPRATELFGSAVIVGHAGRRRCRSRRGRGGRRGDRCPSGRRSRRRGGRWPSLGDSGPNCHGKRDNYEGPYDRTADCSVRHGATRST
jgi:hypothetical protein